MSNLSAASTLNSDLKWEEVGAWQGGTVVYIALTQGVTTTGSVTAHGLLASRAGVYQWTQATSKADESLVQAVPHGLSDPNVVAVAFAGSGETGAATAFAATATGRLYRGNYTAGTSSLLGWEEIPSWAGLGVAVILAPSPTYSHDHTLFAGTPTGIFRTLDDGLSWESCNFGLLDEDVLCLICAPNFDESELLWAGTAGGGLYRSRNRGRAWRESGLGLPDAAVQCMAISPNFRQDRTLFVGMEGHGLYFSQDGGENWKSLALAGHSINTLACAESDLLWAGSEDGLWRVAISSGVALQVAGAAEAVMSVAATAGGQVAAGFFGSGLWITNDGRGEPPAIAWQKPLLALHAPPVIASAGYQLFALDSDGLMAHSGDGGTYWQELALPDSGEVFALGMARNDSKEMHSKVDLFAVTDAGLWRRKAPESDGDWQEIARDALLKHRAVAVEVSPDYANDRRVALLTQDGGLFLSQDGGENWREISGPWRGQTLLHFHFAPDKPNKLVALSAQADATNNYSVTVWETNNLGEQWEVLAGLNSPVPAIVMLWPSDSVEDAIFLATQYRIIKVYTQGEPPTLQVHQHFFAESLQVTALAIAPDYEERHTLWAATTGGLYRSTDRGIQWQLMVELPLELPLLWLDVTLTEITTITLGGRCWRAKF